MNTVAEVLDAAADLLRTQGFIQCELEGPDGHCSLGAIARVMDPAADDLFMAAYLPETAVHTATVAYLADTIRRSGWVSPFKCYDDFDLIATYNDHHTGDEVLQLFYETAAKARDQEFAEVEQPKTVAA